MEGLGYSQAVRSSCPSLLQYLSPGAMPGFFICGRAQPPLPTSQSAR